MRIKEELQKTGYFWLPSTPDNQVPGTLFISNGGIIKLEIFGLFDPSPEGLMKAYDSKNELMEIIGFVEGFKFVKLENCFYLHRQISFGSISKSEIYVNKALLGFQQHPNEDYLFNSFKFSIEGIDDWVGLVNLP